MIKKAEKSLKRGKDDQSKGPPLNSLIFTCWMFKMMLTYSDQTSIIGIYCRVLTLSGKNKPALSTLHISVIGLIFMHLILHMLLEQVPSRKDGTQHSEMKFIFWDETQWLRFWMALSCSKKWVWKRNFPLNFEQERGFSRWGVSVLRITVWPVKVGEN